MNIFSLLFQHERHTSSVHEFRIINLTSQNETHPKKQALNVCYDWRITKTKPVRPGTRCGLGCRKAQGRKATRSESHWVGTIDNTIGNTIGNSIGNTIGNSIGSSIGNTIGNSLGNTITK